MFGVCDGGYDESEEFYQAWVLIVLGGFKLEEFSEGEEASFRDDEGREFDCGWVYQVMELQTMGMKGVGAYDATLHKHADMRNMVWGTMPVAFKWAHLVVDKLSALIEINQVSYIMEGS